MLGMEWACRLRQWSGMESAAGAAGNEGIISWMQNEWNNCWMKAANNKLHVEYLKFQELCVFNSTLIYLYSEDSSK